MTNKELDEKIFEILRIAHTNREICEELDQSAHSEADFRQDPRPVDRALQRMKKEGSINLVKTPHGPRWIRAERKTCPHCNGTGFVIVE